MNECYRYTHGVTAVLVLNKMDRLITELGLSPEEAYQKLRGIVEQVNAVMSMLFRGDLMENDARMYDKNKNWEFKVILFIKHLSS